MSKKTRSQDSNCSGNCKCNCVDWDNEAMLQAYREAAAADDFIFGESDYSSYGWEKMPRNQVTKDELVVRVLKLKNKVDQEPSTVWQGEKDLAHKYLNEVLCMLDEYRM